MDLLALLAEVSDPNYVPSATEIADKAAYDAETARIEAVRAKEAAIANAPKCGKCNGTGHLPHFRHISGGDCFDCDGTGAIL